MLNFQKKYKELENERRRNYMTEEEYYEKLIAIDIEKENMIDTFIQDYIETKFRK